MTPRIGRRLTFTSAQLAAATLWFEGHELPEDLRAEGGELEAAGVALGGRIAPRLGELLAVMLRPEARLSVEVRTPTSTEVDLLWLRAGLAVTAEVADGVMVLEAIDPMLVPTDLARRLGVRGGVTPAPAEPLTIDTALLDELEVEARGRSEAGLRAWVDERGVTDEVWAGALVTAVRDRRASWRVGSGWLTEEGTHARSLTVLDGGRAGAFEVVTEDATSPIVSLVPRSPRDVLTAIRGCLP